MLSTAADTVSLQDEYYSERDLLSILDYSYPFLLTLAFFSTALLNWCNLKPSKQSNGKRTTRERKVALWLHFAILVAYVVQAVIYIIRPLIQKGWWLQQHSILNVLGSIFVWGGISLNLLGSRSPTWNLYCVCWVVGLIFEVAICAMTLLVQIITTPFTILILVNQAVRLVCFIALLGNGIRIYTKHDLEDDTDEESQSLLGGEANGTTTTSNNTPQYGSIPVKTDDAESASESDDPEDRERKIKEKRKKRLEELGVWGYTKSFAVFLPCIWPSGHLKIQLCLALMVLHMVLERFLNVLVPRQIGIITNKLTDGSSVGIMPWKEVLVWIFLQYISSSAGLWLVNSMASAHVRNFSYKRIAELAFSHLMSLSMEFHSNKDSGEVLKSVEQAGSLNDLIEVVGFDLCPVIIDMVVSLFYITYLFDGYMAFLVMVVSTIYLTMAFKLTSIVQPKRRASTAKSRLENKTLYEATSNWETVCQFNRVSYEEERYGNIVDENLAAGMSYYYTWTFCYAAQQLVITLGLLTASFLAVYQISQGQKPVGNFVTFVIYWETMMSPLNRLSWSWKQLTGSLVDAERLLQLIQTEPTVVDSLDATKIDAPLGKVVFEDVDFSYDTRKQTLKGLSFTAEPGQTVAFVGETGGGKSTTLKLLFRFYDVTGGRITIDGQDIRDVTLSSLRETLGVVPQDPSLFNSSIMENVRYAKLDATDEEIMEACRAAAVHDKIMTFPDKYNSKVGERGVKLSGGELQRVAIARVVLKNPSVVLLDEATSAVDSSIEAQIQTAFKKLSANRTTFVVAHRLSTIMDADLILVIDQGKIIERGTHEELIRKGTKYFELWSKQTAGKTSKASSVTATSSDDNLVMLNDLTPGTYSEEIAKNFALGAVEEHPLAQMDGQCESKVKETSCFGKKAKKTGESNQSDESSDESFEPMKLVSSAPTGATKGAVTRHQTNNEANSSGSEAIPKIQVHPVNSHASSKYSRSQGAEGSQATTGQHSHQSSANDEK